MYSIEGDNVDRSEEESGGASRCGVVVSWAVSGMRGGIDEVVLITASGGLDDAKVAVKLRIDIPNVLNTAHALARSVSF
jgi:hypothetical protein